MEIKVGDKVRVREDAPKLYTRWYECDFLHCDSTVKCVESDSAEIERSVGDNGNLYYLTIPLKYLVKVEEEAKGPKFEVGQFAMFKGRRVEIIGYSEHCPQTYRVFVLTENYHADAKESDLDPYTEPTEEKTKPKLITTSPQPILSIADPNQEVTYEVDWTFYTADLAKEVALKVANKYNDPEEVADYAVKVAKAVAEGLKKQ